MKSGFFQILPGTFSYELAFQLQRELNGLGHTGLLAFEPMETITLGLHRTPADLVVSEGFLTERGVQLLHTDRAGAAAYHGPGQLVGFPIGNLKNFYGDSRAVKRFTEELVLDLAHACAVLGVRSVETRSDSPGLWTSRGKLASVGINVKDGYIFHGFALNVTQACVPGHALIQTCGVANCPITSLEQEGVRAGGVGEVAAKIMHYLSVLKGEEILRESRSVQFDTNYTNLVAKVSRSQMAIDHFRSNMESSARSQD